jgi:hypothetical protein
MVAHSPWRAPLRMSWPEIAAVDWRAAANVLEIRNRVGRRVRVSPWLSGIPSLAAELEQRAPGAVGLGEALGAMRSFASTRSQ